MKESKLGELVGGQAGGQQFGSSPALAELPPECCLPGIVVVCGHV